MIADSIKLAVPNSPGLWPRGVVENPPWPVKVNNPYCLVFRAVLGPPGGRWYAPCGWFGVPRAHLWNSCLYRVSMTDSEPKPLLSQDSSRGLYDRGTQSQDSSRGTRARYACRGTAEPPPRSQDSSRGSSPRRARSRGAT